MKDPKSQDQSAVETVSVQGDNWLQELLEKVAARRDELTSEEAEGSERSSGQVSRDTVERLIDRVNSRV